MGRPQQPFKKRKLTITLNPIAVERLARLQVMSQTDSLSEVIRRSLAIYETLLGLRDEAGTVTTMDSHGNQRQIIIDF